MALKISTEEVSESTVVLHIQGQITLGDNALEFREALREICRPGKRVILDLAHVDYIDSSGFGALVSGYIDAQKTGAQVVLAGATAKIRSLLEMTKMSQIFTLYDNVEQATKDPA